MSSQRQGSAFSELDRLDLDSFAGRPVAVLGLARSGVALCRFLVDRGAVVTAYDIRRSGALADQLAQLEGRPLRLLLGPDVDPRDALAGQALICTSPSISSRYPTTEPRLRSALRDVEVARRVPIVSEIDLFLRLSPAVAVGVTGTKGKTTTASLAAAVLGAGDAPVLLGGNTGAPLIERLPELTEGHRVVLELSELQLPTLHRGTAVAVFTNVTLDHLDRHGSVEAYRAVKRRLAELTPADGRLVLNADDAVSAGFAAVSSAAAVYYGRTDPPSGSVGIRDGWLVGERVERLPGVVDGWSTAGPVGPVGRIMPVDDIRLPGAHNVSNVLAAVTVGLLFGIAADRLRQAIRSFKGLEHRLETVLRLDGVLFVNDTKATQVDAVIAALHSFEPPIVLIAGGGGKDLPLDGLAREVAARASAAVLIGETGPEMARLFRAAGARNVEQADDMQQAVSRAFRLARDELATTSAREATILLSPAASGVETFTNRSVRGDEFKDAVRKLAALVAVGRA